jgi:hypothetical protein
MNEHTEVKRYRTRQEMIEYFKQLAFDFYKSGGMYHNDFDLGKAEAYEMAAFELEHNMEG